MRSKLVLAALLFLSTLPMYAQVAPAAKEGGIPLGVGVGLIDFDSSYYYPNLPYWSGRLIGVSAWADYNIFHGFGVTAEGTDLLAGKPTPISLTGQTLYGSGPTEATIQGGIIYRYHSIFKVRPFVEAMGGAGRIDFPTTDPFYTEETSPLWSASAGIEYHAYNNFFLRGKYEYQSWKGFRAGSGQTLTPSGATIGVTYYLRGPHRRY